MTDTLSPDLLALATPASILVYDGPPHTPGWFDARLQGITASDIPMILGDSKYGNARTVWARKRGLVDDDDAGEAAHWGTILEDPIAAEWGRRRDTRVRALGVLANAAAPWQRASLDRLVAVCPDGDGPCGLEVKNKSEWLSGRWADDVPEDVHGQVAWQMLVTGYRHMHVAALIGGNRLQSHRVDWDPEVEAYVVAAARAVWDAVIDPDAPAPEVAPNALAIAVMNQIHPNREGVKDVDVATAAALLANLRDAETGLREANAVAADAKAVKVAAIAAIVDQLGPADTLAVNDSNVPLFTYRQKSRAGYTVRPATVMDFRVQKVGVEDLDARRLTAVPRQGAATTKGEVR